MRIVRLPEDVANRIAAGEVVERPASVVKELVENSIDAGAATIQVEVVGGGLELISVTDDGCGMDSEDAVLAFERHATSKIAKAEDLFSVVTLGFRGEALPSVASVARVRLVTRTADAREGTAVTIEGGRVLDVFPIGAPEGSTVQVRDLFFNTPARLKYLKSVAAETRRIVDIAGKLALAHPEVSMHLTIDGRTVFSTPSGGSLGDAAAAVLGLDLARHMLPVQGRWEDITVGGLAAPPRFARRTRDVQHLIVNGRPVVSRTVWSALDRAYGRTVPEGKRAPAVIVVSVDPGKVDVNVHPAKSEVRFASEDSLYRAVFGAVAGALRSLDSTGGLEPQVPAGIGKLSGGSAAKPVASTATRTYQRVTEGEGLFRERDVPVSGGSQVAPVTPLPVPRVIGQLDATFILAESEGTLFIVDQHAAHERVLVDSFRARVARGPVETQLLMVPEVIDLPAREVDAVTRNAEVLHDLGLEVEPFGGNSVLLRGIPSGAGDVSPIDLLWAAIEGLISAPPGANTLDFADHVAVSLACKGAVRAGAPLTPDAMEGLVTRLFACADPYRCPHGRPTVVAFSPESIRRSFGRR
ncbi:MAG: DNA mismatch repair endonuclease MutL [Firmicutes bacterium]|jgi:DNA mismatch repair protein MutL|nr:DNA mismatch repair endonuclease MutL [Bacillota bacterium]